MRACLSDVGPRRGCGDGLLAARLASRVQLVVAVDADAGLAGHDTDGSPTGDDTGRLAGLVSAGRRWRVDDVGCLTQRAGYPLSRPHPLQLFGQLGDQLAQWRQVKHSRLAAGVCHPPGPGRLSCAACLVSQAAGDQAAQPRSLSHRDVPAGAGADRRIRGSTRLRITGSISLRILRHHNHLTSRPWTAWPA